MTAQHLLGHDYLSILAHLLYSILPQLLLPPPWDWSTCLEQPSSAEDICLRLGLGWTVIPRVVQGAIKVSYPRLASLLCAMGRVTNKI